MITDLQCNYSWGEIVDRKLLKSIEKAVKKMLDYIQLEKLLEIFIQTTQMLHEDEKKFISDLQKQVQSKTEWITTVSEYLQKFFATFFEIIRINQINIQKNEELIVQIKQHQILNTALKKSDESGFMVNLNKKNMEFSHLVL